MLPDQTDQMNELIQMIPRDAGRTRVVQRPLSHFRPEDLGIPAQQQYFHFRQGGSRKNLLNLSRNPRCDAAVDDKFEHAQVSFEEIKAHEKVGPIIGAFAGPGDWRSPPSRATDSFSNFFALPISQSVTPQMARLGSASRGH